MDIKKLLDIDGQNVTPMIPAARLEEMVGVALAHAQKPPLSATEKVRRIWDAHPWAQRGFAIAACIALLFTVVPLPSLTQATQQPEMAAKVIGNAQSAANAIGEGNVYSVDDDDFTDLMVLATLDDL